MIIGSDNDLNPNGKKRIHGELRWDDRNCHFFFGTCEKIKQKCRMDNVDERDNDSKNGSS